ncbi:MAG: aldehyde dehydrogenase family protein [Alphaproteobacteria bacterium]|nr:aldehyde dehydrogenase family protein [Alphaproteobacteria bacterium]
MKYNKIPYIGGALTKCDKQIDVVNPANEEIVGRVDVAGISQVQQALQVAQMAVASWGNTSITERKNWMLKLRDEVIKNQTELRTAIHFEMGKPWHATQEDYDSLVNSLHFYAEEIARIRDEALIDRDGTHSHRLVHQPIGVCVGFLAWNFPLLNLAFKIGPAMAAGCPIILRPSASTPISAYMVGELCEKIGLPKGVVQILCTDSHEASDALSASVIPAMITLIGSTATGCHIMKMGATSIKRYSMELGGNSPVLIFDDADLDLAADIVCGIKFNNAGQICVAPNRVFVAKSVAQAFTAKCVERANQATVGFDKDATITTGPLINGKAWQDVKRLIDEAVRDGANLLAGGDRPADLPPHLAKGHYIAPTVISDVTENMALYKQEIFGPVVSIIEFDDDTPQLIAKANDCGDGGLTAYIFTKDLNLAETLAAKLRYGEIQINGVRYDIDLPHGGIGQAGIGHDCSHLALNDYLVIKRISRALKI